MAKKLTQNEFISRVSKIHKNYYNYSATLYKNKRTKVKIICPKHGEFEQTPDSHMRGRGCYHCGLKKISAKKTLTTNKFIKKAKNKHGDKYDYTKTIYTGTYDRIKISCPLHGEFEQRPNDHLNGCGCEYCNNKRKHLVDFVAESNIIHNNKYNYSLTEYKIMTDHVNIICPIHGKFQQRASIHLSGSGCQICQVSKGERKVKNFLKNSNIFFIYQKKFDNLKNKNKNKLSYDFFLPNHNKLIEYNGMQHYIPIKYFGGERTLKMQKNHDKLKREYAQNNGYELLEIPYTQFNNIEKILSDNLDEIIIHTAT